MHFLFDSVLMNLLVSTAPGPAPTSKKAKAAKAGPVRAPSPPVVSSPVPAPITEVGEDDDSEVLLNMGISQAHAKYLYDGNDDDDDENGDDDDDDEFEGMSAIPCPRVTRSLLF
jgi:hypothetical protein